MTQAPGWYDDPENPRRLRWWTGKQWSNRWMERPGGPPAQSPTPIPLVGSPPVVGYAASSSPSAYANPSQPSGGPNSGPWPAPPRSFTEAVRVCFQKYAVFQGRASRSEYWYWGLFVLLARFAVLFLVGTMYATTTSETAFGLSSLLDAGISLALIIPGLAVAVRRLHDIGKSGWNLLWAIVPIGGAIALLVWFIRSGEPRPNAYG